MQKNYSPMIEMQIPKGNLYTGMNTVSNFDDEFEKLTRDYEIHRME